MLGVKLTVKLNLCILGFKYGWEIHLSDELEVEYENFGKIPNIYFCKSNK